MSQRPALSPKPQLILFDADGTLYESERLSFEASRLAARELHDFDLNWEQFHTDMIRGNRTTAEALGAQGLAVDPDLVQAAKRAHYDWLVVEELKPMPGLLDFLAWCDQQSIACAIVSSNRRKAVDVSLQTLGISEFFQAIVSHEDIADRRKPDPYPFQLGLRIADMPASQAIAVEDTAKGIASAQAAGLRCIGIRNETNEPADLAEAELIISGYAELQAYLTKLA